MTGYGSSILELESYPLTLEFSIQSVNRKNLDCQITVPQDWNGLDRTIHDWIKGHLERGRITIQLRINKRVNAKQAFQINHSLLDETIEKFSSYAQSKQIPFELNASSLIQLSQLNQNEDSLPNWQDFESSIKEAFESAFHSFQAMRAEEGKQLKADIIKRISIISENNNRIRERSKTASKDYAELLNQRLKAMNLELNLEDDRILKEIALFSDRSDISEELVRLDSHFEQFSHFLNSQKANGRKMDFLCVEVFRELNTIASKTNQLEVTRCVIDSKNELERIREQVQNIE